MPAPTETGRMTPPSAPSPELVFVYGRERRVVLLDHVPFKIDLSFATTLYGLLHTLLTPIAGS